MSLLIAPLALANSVSTYSWIQTTKTAEKLAADGMETCAGISTECNSLETCTEVAIGPCKDATAGPEYYINQYSHSLAFLSDADAYLTDSTKVVQAEKWSGLNVKGYRDVNGDKTEGTAKYAYIMTGAWYGSAVSGGYVGSGSYLMKSGTISTNKNTFYVSTTAGETAVTRDDSTFGAPIGPYQGCISPLTDGACGAARTFKTGDYKFSIYGYTAGTAFALPKVPTTGAEDAKFFGLRTLVALKLKSGADVPSTNLEIHFNGDPTLNLETLGSKDVSSFTLYEKGGTESIKYDFPKKYNIFPIPTGTSGDMGVPTATKDVKIRVSLVPGRTAIYVDYIFDAADFNVKDKVFIYDPDVSVGLAPAATSGATTGARIATGAAIGLAAAAAALL